MMQVPTPRAWAARQKVWAEIPASNTSHVLPLEVVALPSFSIPEMFVTTDCTASALQRVSVRVL